MNLRVCNLYQIIRVIHKYVLYQILKKTQLEIVYHYTRWSHMN
nr:MAG TPA: hypothetical protein [Caudoviricetes sp.]